MERKIIVGLLLLIIIPVATWILMGIAIDQGKISSVNEKMINYYQEENINNNNELKQLITLKDLLIMRGGFDWDEFSPYFTGKQSPIKEMNRTLEHVKFAINAPMLNTPGRTFAYNTGGTVILLDILRKSAGMPSDKFADKNLFRPLRIKS